MEASVLAKGLLLGFSIAAPVGPIGVLCIRRTITDGRTTGFITGLGAATADALYGFVAAFGLTFVTNILVGANAWIHLLGGLFLIYLGVGTFLAPPAEQAASVRRTGLWGAYLSTFFITVTSPMTIISFAAVFAALGIKTSSVTTAGLLPLAVFIGSGVWWLMLSGGVALVRDRFDRARMRMVNRISGLMIIAFGLYGLLK